MSLSKTVAILSDTHGYLNPQVANVVRSCDFAVHAGDICGKKVLDALKPRTGKVIAVRGNNDHPYLWSSEESDTVASLEKVATLKLPGGELLVEHGDRWGHHRPSHEKLRKAHPHVRLIVYGHSHKLIIDQDEMPWVVNPGAAGKTRTHGGASCLVLTVHPDCWELEAHRFADH